MLQRHKEKEKEVMNNNKYVMNPARQLFEYRIKYFIGSEIIGIYKMWSYGYEEDEGNQTSFTIYTSRPIYGFQPQRKSFIESKMDLDILLKNILANLPWYHKVFKKPVVTDNKGNKII